jgi:ABC-type cobalamin/Fe3+-siderophores transport system ATPase subunit
MDRGIQIPAIQQPDIEGAMEFAGAHLHSGESVAIAGRNGAGKTVLLKALLFKMKKNIGWVSNYREPFLDMRVQEVIEIAQMNQNHIKTERILKSFSLINLRNHGVNVLSDGEFMRLMLARVTAQDPEIFLLDEPDAHLDFYYKQELKSIVQDWLNIGKVVIYSTHDEQWVRSAGQLWWVENGRVTTEEAAHFEFRKIGNR